MIKPPALKPGDRIALVSLASPFAREEFDKGAAELKRLGFEPVYHDSVFDRSVFTSGPPELRAAAFVRAWSDPAVSALLAVRGGYGSQEILPLLDGWQPQHHPKLFIGYSDNTSVLSWLTCQAGIAALHGPMIDGRLAKGTAGYDEPSFTAMLRGHGAGLELRPNELVTLHDGGASGPLFGGTLTQLVGSLGTPYAFNPPDGCVLFVEDVNERPYRLHRMMTQLQFSGILGRASAIVFGEMRGCDEPDGALTARETIASFFQDWDIPVLFGFPSGHTTGPCWTLPLGVGVRIEGGDGPVVVVEESPVA
jgi:muramoyltetrapeptide carboxypeptidase